MRDAIDLLSFPVRAIDRAAPYSRWVVYYAMIHYGLLGLGCWLIREIARTFGA